MCKILRLETDPEHWRRIAKEVEKESPRTAAQWRKIADQLESPCRLVDKPSLS
jgi:hypothetical protein